MRTRTFMLFFGCISLALLGCGDSSGGGGGTGDATTGDPVPDTLATTTGDSQVPGDLGDTGPMEDSSSGTTGSDTTLVPDTTEAVDTIEDVDTPEDTRVADTGASPEDSVDTSTPPVGSPSLRVSVDGELAAADSELDLPTVPPGLDALVLIPILVENVGDGPLDIEKLFLSSINENGSPKNVWVFLEWGESQAPPPLVLAPGEQFEVSLRYTPKTLDPNDATLRLVGNDPTSPVFVLRFLGPPIEPRVRVEPPFHQFAQATLTITETRTFEIHNDGLVALTVQQVQVVSDSERFWLVDAPTANAVIKPYGHPSYEPLSFTVAYKPVYGMGTELATVHVYSTDPTKNPAIIPLSTTFETTDSVSHCLFGYDTEAEGVLNFGEATVGTVTARILGTNVGTTSCALDSVMLSNDPNQTWYEYEVLDLGADPEGSGSPVNTFPLTFEPGQHVAVDVHYKAPGFSVLADLTLSFSDEQSHLKEIPLQGSGVPPCIEWAPGSVADPLPLQFVGEQASNVTRSFAVYNCGEGALALTNAWIEDDETPGEPSQHWTLLSSLSGYKVIPGNRVEVFDLAMYVTTNDTTLNGTLFVEHVDVNGPQMLSVDLQGSISATTVLPTADPGTPEDYADLVAGVPFILDGSASGAFAPAPAPEGYIWYLSNKPNNSALIVNGPPGPPQHIVTPDVEGYYTFSLIVHTAGDAPLYSSPGSVTVLVAPAPEPPPEEEGTP